MLRLSCSAANRLRTSVRRPWVPSMARFWAESLFLSVPTSCASPALGIRMANASKSASASAIRKLGRARAGKVDRQQSHSPWVPEVPCLHSDLQRPAERPGGPTAIHPENAPGDRPARVAGEVADGVRDLFDRCHLAGGNPAQDLGLELGILEHLLGEGGFDEGRSDRVHADAV